MKKFVFILLLLLAQDQLLAGLSIHKGTDTDIFGFGKFGISTSKQVTGEAAPDTDNLLLETGDALLLETSDKILME